MKAHISVCSPEPPVRVLHRDAVWWFTGRRAVARPLGETKQPPVMVYEYERDRGLMRSITSAWFTVHGELVEEVE